MSQRDVRVRPMIKGINQVMRGPGAAKAVNEAAYRALSDAGPGHEVIPAPVRKHPWVARAYIQQEDAAQARRDPDGLKLLRAIA